MGKTLWAMLVITSMASLISYLGFQLFSTPTISPPSAQDPYEALFDPSFSPTTVVVVEEKREVAAKEIKQPENLREPIRNESPPVVEYSDPSVEAQKVQQKDTVQLGKIQQELAELPAGPESAPARTLLLHSASDLNLDERGADEVHEIAMNELLQGKTDEVADGAQSSSFAYFLPVLAHEVALKTAQNPSDAFNLTLDGVMVHADPGVRYSLVRQFVTKFPDLEPQLREELYNRHIRTDLQAN
ncbi:MAG: hypothetical protein JWQ35_792 [Bacteriovoracaceae bacterium]|nr:hypothetical protein [Bacteriovoracaceae bacterium]